MLLVVVHVGSRSVKLVVVHVSSRSVMQGYNLESGVSGSDLGSTFSLGGRLVSRETLPASTTSTKQCSPWLVILRQQRLCVSGSLSPSMSLNTSIVLQHQNRSENQHVRLAGLRGFHC